MTCVKQHMEETPIANVKIYVPCCQLSASQKCQSICEEVLSMDLTTEEAIDKLEGSGCGPPLPQDPMWQCFLAPERQQPPLTSNSSGMDSAKLHCCQKALAPKCRRLCLNTFSNNWIEGWQDFEMNCFSSTSEHGLRQCIEEVDEPCDLGCDSLSFCTNFNARPTELFRSCTTAADSSAKQSLELWQSSGQILLPGLQLPLKNISKCSPATWKAVACALHIKPCNYNSHSNQICREDCYSLLNECLDWAQLHETEHSAASLCAKMSPSDKSTPCISLAQFLNPSELIGASSDPHVVKSPCRQNPCEQNQVCQVDSNLPTGFRCVPGCVLGEASSYLVPMGSYIRIPVTGQNGKGCLKICRCNENGHIDSCQPLPCISYESCSLAGRSIAHLSWFYVECNICSCFAGEITCTKKQCRIQGVSDHSYTSFPCNCPAHYVPVCAKNGKTYPNACIAKCNGFQDFEFDYGACDAKKACEDHDCPAHSVCVPERQVCLSSMHRPCLQYQCVNISGHCRDPLPAPMCDSREKTHSSMCHLIRSKEVLSYAGHCSRQCGKNKVVCGINGVTYRSECEAWSDFSTVDYPGECREVGLLTATLGDRCVQTKCKTLLPNCLSIIPPGACCPVCSGSFRVIYSRKQIDRALYALNEKNSHLLTLKYVLKSLSALIRIADCRLSGFLTIESDIFVTVQSSREKSSDIQLEACHREAEKIATLISTQSHRITSDLTLGALTFANMAQPDINSSAAAISRLLASPLLFFSLFIVCLKGLICW